jgi:hypothetical protein
VQAGSADRHFADGVVRDVALIVGVDEILRGPVPLRKRGENSVQFDATFIS